LGCRADTVSVKTDVSSDLAIRYPFSLQVPSDAAGGAPLLVTRHEDADSLDISGGGWRRNGLSTVTLHALATDNVA